MYYDIHIFHDRKNSFSVPFESKHLDEQDIIEDAINNGVLDTEDARAVDSVDLLTEDEYKRMKNI